MVFSSTVFLCGFLPAVLIIYYLCPLCVRNLFLLVASLIFYAWGEPVYVLIMLFTILFDYGAGLLIEKAEGGAKRKALLALTVIVNLGILCFFKYTDFAIETANSLFGTAVSYMRLALPIGISFYTFQTLSYVVDVYRGNVRAQHRIVDFAMYVTMFPQLIAGPIVRYSDIEHQLSGREVTAERFSKGVFRFIIGLGKKVLLANQIGLLWDEVYALGGDMSALTAWLGALAFTFQIYFDFSGYSDMAVGIGGMLGFDFPENFRYPYESKSITEFWRRWHMTLGTWFREYLYIPLGGNRKGIARQILNLLIVWSLTGLWHGAGWNFVLWGLYFFVILVAEKLFLLMLLQRCPKWVGHVYALLLIILGWVIFACD
ncbi:MAG: MBOAT family protein, partial [Oscillospiraceae bacterium]|nr:MBOAT family protein [Oscillospiraceae bacterium]